MSTEEILDIIKDKIVELLPELDKDNISKNDSMKSLGANSMDRFDIISDTMNETKIRVPFVEFGNLSSIGAVAELLYEKQS